MKTAIIAAIVVVLIAVVGVGAFFAGSAYGQQQVQNTRAEFFNARGGGANGQFSQNGQGGQQFGRPAATGTVKSVDGNTLVVSQRDGSTVTVTINSQTQIIKTVNGTTSDLQPGENITVMSNQTGSTITAQTIQLRPTAQTTQ